MIFAPKKGGHFFDIFDPLPPPPSKAERKWLSNRGGGLGGVRTKNSLGGASIGQNNDFTRG